MEDYNEKSSYEECSMGCRTTFGSPERDEEERLRRMSPKEQSKYLLRKEFNKEIAIKKAALLLKNTRLDIQYLPGLDIEVKQDLLDTIDMSIESVEPKKVDDEI